MSITYSLLLFGIVSLEICLPCTLPPLPPPPRALPLPRPFFMVSVDLSDVTELALIGMLVVGLISVGAGVPVPPLVDILDST